MTRTKPYRTSEVAELAGVTRRQITRLCAEGKLYAAIPNGTDHVRQGAHDAYAIPATVVEHWLRTGRWLRTIDDVRREIERQFEEQRSAKKRPLTRRNAPAEKRPRAKNAC